MLNRQQTMRKGQAPYSENNQGYTQTKTKKGSGMQSGGPEQNDLLRITQSLQG